MPIWCFLFVLFQQANLLPPGEVLLFLLMLRSEQMNGTGLASVLMDGIGLTSIPLARWG